jgi:hypothetical protein
VFLGEARGRAREGTEPKRRGDERDHQRHAELDKTRMAALISSFCCLEKEQANHDVISETDH